MLLSVPYLIMKIVQIFRIGNEKTLSLKYVMPVLTSITKLVIISYPRKETQKCEKKVQ